MRAKKEGKCPLCRRPERYETETSLYTCPNRKCKFSHFWFSPAEWSKLCRTVRSRAPEADHTEQPLEMVTLRDRFAMAALTGLFFSTAHVGSNKVAVAFDVADECMKQRKAQEGE